MKSKLIGLIIGLGVIAGCQTTPPTIAPSPTTAPTTPPTSVNAIYQAFEHGWMLWREEMNCVYSYTSDSETHIIVPDELANDYTYCVPIDGLSPIADATPPTGLSFPSGSLGAVWNTYPTISDALGYSTQAEQSYIAAIPSSPTSTNDGAPFSQPVMTLPDGQVLWCGFRAATVGSCHLE
jgi:hypothetical protein